MSLKQEILKVCKVCESMENLIDLSIHEFSHLNEKLHRISDFEEKYNNWLKYICISCSTKLENAFNFKIQCEFTFKKLSKMVENMVSSESFPKNPLQDNKENLSKDKERGTKEKYSLFGVDIEFSDVKKDQKFNKQFQKDHSQELNDPPEKENSTRVDKSHGIFICDLCGKDFKRKKGLKNHIEGHHLKNRSYICNICDATFLYYSTYHKHRQSHSGQTFPCDICGKIFLVKAYMSKHRKGHLGKTRPKIRMYLCHFCGFGSSNIYQHVEHLRIHSGLRPFKCDKCDKSFAQKQGLKIHSLTHSDNRPYACHICSSAFRKSSHLTSHINSHSGEKKHKCQACDKSFTTASGLRIHMRLHTGELPYECSTCLMKFRLRKMLVSHKKKCISSFEKQNKE